MLCCLLLRLRVVGVKEYNAALNKRGAKIFVSRIFTLVLRTDIPKDHEPERLSHMPEKRKLKGL